MNGIAWLALAVPRWLENGLVLAIQAGLCAGLLALAVLAINICCRRWVTARQMGLLWGLVLLRLLIPVAPPSALSLQNLLPTLGAHTSEPDAPSIQPDALTAGGGYEAPLAYGDQPAVLPAPLATSAADIDAAAGPSTAEMLVESLLTLLPVVWLLAAATMLLWAGILQVRFHRRLKSADRCSDLRILRLWDECRQRAGIRRLLPVLQLDGLGQPGILGLWRPTLLLPDDADQLTDQQLRMVMLHELGHVRHGDLAVNWILLVVRAFHWWNPVFWLAALRYATLREQACDAFAIRRLEGDATRDYGDLLLSLAGRTPARLAWQAALPASLLGFLSAYFRRRAVIQRMRALRTAAMPHCAAQMIGVAALIVLLAVCGLTDARAPTSSTGREADWLPRAGHDGSQWTAAAEQDPGPLETRSYDLSKALDRIAIDAGSSELALRNLQFLLSHMIDSANKAYAAGDVEHARRKADDPPCRMAIEGATLKVDAPSRWHAELASSLLAWEQSGLAQICVAARFLMSDKDLASQIGVSWRYLEAYAQETNVVLPKAATFDKPVVRATSVVDDYLPLAVAVISNRQAAALLAAAQGDRRANVLQSPKITLFNGQRASILDVSQSPFVIGIQDLGAGKQQPKIAVIDEGVKLSLRAVQSSDGGKLQLEGLFEFSAIGEVHNASATLNGRPTTIQIPRVKRCHIDVASEIADGETILVGCIPTYEQKRFLYLLLTANRLSADGQ